MDLNMPILSVKLKMPQPRKNYIVRQNLFNQLSKLNEYKVTVVKSGAGSGKTTLLSSFIKETKLNNIKWISLDRNSNQTFVFWNYIIETVKEYFKDSQMDFQTLFNSNMQKDNLWQILLLLADKLNIDDDIILVLDDFHMISETFLISTIDYFIENMPDNVHIILLTREMPSINLGTLAVENKIMVLDESLIRLSKEESKEFLKSTLQLNKDDEQLNSMIESAEGWIGGLQLLAVAYKDKNTQTMQTLKFSSRMLEDYISREIFMYLSKEEQEFLIETSILTYFNEAICKKYLPNIQFHNMMESILKKNLFVINLDENEEIYHYHAILTEYLLGIFDEFDDKKKIYLHNLASDIYYELNDYEECLNHLFIINDYEKIMKLLLEMPSTSLIFSYILRVPMEEIIKNSDFAYQYYFCHYASADIEACKKTYNFINTNMKDDKSFEGFKHSDIFFDDKMGFKKIKTLSIKQIKELPLNPVTISFLLIKESFFLYVSSKYKEALEYLDSAEDVYRETGNMYIGFFVFCEKAMIFEDMGELNICYKLYEKMKPMIKKMDVLATSYYIGIAGVYMKQFLLDKAFEVLEKSRQIIEHNSDNMERIYRAYQYNLAGYYYLIGDDQKTENLLMEVMGQEIYQGIYDSARLLLYPTYRGTHKELSANFAKQYESAEDIVKMMDTDLLYANIKYENKETDKAKEIVDSIVSQARKAQNKLKIIEGDLFKVRILLDENTDKRSIQNLFLEAVCYAAENSIALPFWFEKETAKKVLKEMNEEIQKKLSPYEWTFLCNVLKADSKNKMIESPKKFDDLTEREKEVLKELAEGSSNKQIAEKLFISLATVKSHIINIYGKLGVSNRVAAVNKFKLQGNEHQ